VLFSAPTIVELHLLLIADFSVVSGSHPSWISNPGMLVQFERLEFSLRLLFWAGKLKLEL